MHGLFRCVATALIVAATGVAQAAPTPAGGQAPPSSSATLININTATAAQLESLPGIGTQTALRIVEQREKSGTFKKIEELMNVRGIGEKSFLKLKPLITVGPTAPAKADTARQTAQP